MESTQKSYISDLIGAWRYLTKKRKQLSFKKTFIFIRMKKKHEVALRELKSRRPIRVVFLVFHSSVWKSETIYRRMNADPFFDPLIFVCPCVINGEDKMWKDLEETYSYFVKSGYKTISAFENARAIWLKMTDISPDIVFFQSPHKLTLKEYYEDIYLNYISCYVPYHHEVGSYDNDLSQYNQSFHNAQWKIFACHKGSLNIFRSTCSARGKNVCLSGYPGVESLIEKKRSRSYQDVWKSSDSRVRIIWAPHHTIDSAELPYANFLKYAEAFRLLAIARQDSIIWSFKPHPALKPKLYAHPAWGREKTDAYYDFWANQPFAQLDLTEYDDLFCTSDALIHDCGSFLAEYLYVRKPVLYLMSEQNSNDFFSDFGQKALNACHIARSFQEIEQFIDGVEQRNNLIKKEHDDFLENTAMPYFSKTAPSERIIETIKSAIEA